MASISLHAISVEFPIFHAKSRSLKNRFLRMSTGGRILQDSNKNIIIRALDKIDLTINHGQRIALIGYNGSGKSTLLRLLAKIYEPIEGTLHIEGQISPILNLLSGIEPELSGYDNIKSRGILLGLSNEQIADRTPSIVEFSGLDDYLAMPIRVYSTGMLVRLAFSVALHIDPDILLIDEVFGAADAAFQEKAQKKMADLLDRSSIVVFASHNEKLIREFCNEAILLENGKIKSQGNINKILKEYVPNSNYQSNDG